jgi:hypothetical protein
MASLDELKQQLQETNQAISKIKLGGQEVQSRNGRVKLADLNILRQEKAELERQIAAAESTNSLEGSTFGTPVFYCGRG